MAKFATFFFYFFKKALILTSSKNDFLFLFCFLFVTSLLPENLKPFPFHWNLKAVLNYRASYELK